eukprot:m.43012 g.43012  ORF g.43012 m.43012 type:complete len:91 (-) comp10754_c0_seq2:544-816(-)
MSHAIICGVGAFCGHTLLTSAYNMRQTHFENYNHIFTQPRTIPYQTESTYEPLVQQTERLEIQTSHGSHRTCDLSAMERPSTIVKLFGRC